MFKGLSAFPLTPAYDDRFDEESFILIMKRLVQAEVDFIGILGSTGNYAYLTREERAYIGECAIKHSNNIPVMICIGAMSTKQILYLAEDAQKIGAKALLLPVMTYQKLKDHEVYELYEKVTQQISVPLCVYDNPGTTHFNFSDELYSSIASLPKVASIKIPGVPEDINLAKNRIETLRQKIPSRVSIGVSGDKFAGIGLNAGCECWYSVFGGLFPVEAKAITEAWTKGEKSKVTELIQRLSPLWRLYEKHNGSIRVIATMANILGLTKEECLFHPLKAMCKKDRDEIASVMSELSLK